MTTEIKEVDIDRTHMLAALKEDKVRPIIVKLQDTKQEVEFSEMKIK